MFSPGCRVIIQKLSGCDWLQCTQCKMEICVSLDFQNPFVMNLELFFSSSGQLVVLDGVLVVVGIHQVDVDVVSIKANYVPKTVKIVIREDLNQSLVCSQIHVFCINISLTLFSNLFTVILHFLFV